MTDAELTEYAHAVLADRYKPAAFWGSAFTIHQWVNAAEGALDGGDFTDLLYYIAEDERMDRECRDETRRNGCDYADYLYDNREIAA